MSELLVGARMSDVGEQIRTQISGKYSPDNPGVFAFKRQLVEAGVDVRFPVGDHIIEYECDFAVTVPHERITPFHITEVEFLRQIRKNHLQVTYNIYKDNDGYMGESTSIETLYALVRDKPVVLLRKPDNFSRVVPDPVRELVKRYADEVIIEPLDRLPSSELAARLGAIVTEPVNYGLSAREKETVMSEARILTRKYGTSWKEYCTKGLSDEITGTEGTAG